MSADGDKAVVRRYFAMVNDGQLDTLSEELFASDYQLHRGSSPALDRAGTIGLIKVFMAAFPSLHHAIEDQISEGNRVATRIVVRGTHQGVLMGLAPTGKDVAFDAIYIHRIEEGRIAEQWVVSDGLGMMQQLGTIPATGQDTNIAPELNESLLAGFREGFKGYDRSKDALYKDEVPVPDDLPAADRLAAFLGKQP